MAIESLQGSLLNKEVKNLVKSMDHLGEGVKNAVVEEHQAEKEAERIENQLALAQSKKDKLRAKKNLKKAEKKL